MQRENVILVSILLTGCQQFGTQQNVSKVNTEAVGSEKRVATPIAKEALFWQKATVRYIEDSGGFYGLITEKGEMLLPFNLPDNFKINGVFVNILGTKTSGVVTAIRWGTPFDIKQINLLPTEN